MSPTLLDTYLLTYSGPSNSPIEDDHAEKIIEVPSNLAATDNGATASDWMFWGVFDGHRYVKTLL